MGTLNADQVQREVDAIANADAWPYYPVLPMKNIYKSITDPKRLAILVSTADGPQPVVYYTTLFSLTSGYVMEQLEDVERDTFPSIKAMVEAGWLGD